MLLCLLMTSCDLSDQTKGWKTTRKIAQELIIKSSSLKEIWKKPWGTGLVRWTERKRTSRNCRSASWNISPCPSTCCLNCFLGPPSFTREWQQIVSSGPKCPTSSPSVGCQATTAWTSWTRSTSCCSPRGLSGAMTTASMVA
uniref:Phosphodiesterase 2A n=1 Tax=Amphiprion percula TaxID=161767 RepID=A0A3P8TPC7_AMPPE